VKLQELTSEETGLLDRIPTQLAKPELLTIWEKSPIGNLGEGGEGGRPSGGGTAENGHGDESRPLLGGQRIRGKSLRERKSDPKK